VEAYLRAYSDGLEAEISLTCSLWRLCYSRLYSYLAVRTPYEFYIEMLGRIDVKGWNFPIMSPHLSIC